MRKASTFTSLTFSALTIWLAVAAGLATVWAGPAVSQTASSAPAEHTAEPSCERLYVEGCARLQAGDTTTAIKLLTRAAAQQPENLDCAGKLAEAHGLAGNWPAVRKVLSRLEDKLEPDALAMLAKAYAETGAVTDATAILQRGLRRWPNSETLWLALIDRTLDSQQCGLALRRIGQARRHLEPAPQLHFRAAQAYYRSGQVLGETRVRHVPGGRAGQFVGGWLLVERRDQPDRFLCCPPESALYSLRRALDAGLDEPGAHLLHARIWLDAGRPEIGLRLLESREALLLEDASSETLDTFADLALAASALDDFLRYARLRAALDPQRRTQILYDACLAAAERYNQRGDDAMYEALLRRALTLRPDNVGVMLRLADAVWDAGAREEAAIWYRRVLERQPVHRERSRILRRLED
jgi:Tfp pilus assembly protein PilF